VGRPAELLALVHYLLGFHPTSSLVIVALAGSTVRNVARLDLPATANQTPPPPCTGWQPR
jgi:hypothetical protein